MVSLLII